MGSATYPKAIFADNGISGGEYTSGPPKLVIHTTETSGMPGYDGGLSAPHLTYDPRSRIFVQHRPFTSASRALRNEAGGVQTNRDMALQLEIICYSSKPLADQQPYRDWVGDLDGWAMLDLSNFIDWVCTDWGIQKVWPGKQALSYSEANKSGFRMTPEEWDSFNGVCGHQHVPENTHWDPGAIDWKQLPLEDDMPLTAEEKAELIKGTALAVHQFPIQRSSGETKFIQEVANLTAAVAAVKSLVLNLASVDEAEIASLVLAGLPPAVQAGAVAEDVVEAVRDELNRRLAD